MDEVKEDFLQCMAERNENMEVSRARNAKDT